MVFVYKKTYFATMGYNQSKAVNTPFIVYSDRGVNCLIAMLIINNAEVQFVYSTNKEGE